VLTASQYRTNPAECTKRSDEPSYLQSAAQGLQFTFTRSTVLVFCPTLHKAFSLHIQIKRPQYCDPVFGGKMIATIQYNSSLLICWHNSPRSITETNRIIRENTANNKQQNTCKGNDKSHLATKARTILNTRN
jgi:hypothetical protein